MKRVLMLAALAIAGGALLVASASAAKVQREVRYVRLVVESGFYVDNDPSGQSGGDLFGSAGKLTRNGHNVGTFSSTCTASAASQGECNATLIWNSGERLQLAGEIHIQEVKNQLSIVGGTGKYKKARGDATLTRVDDQDQVQRIKLRIVL